MPPPRQSCLGAMPWGHSIYGFTLTPHPPALLMSCLALVGTIASAIWLIWHHFWFLEISVGGVPLRVICQLLVAALVVSLIAPGVVLSGVTDRLVRVGLEGFLLVQVVLANRSTVCPLSFSSSFHLFLNFFFGFLSILFSHMSSICHQSPVCFSDPCLWYLEQLLSILWRLVTAIAKGSGTASAVTTGTAIGGMKMLLAT